MIKIRQIKYLNPQFQSSVSLKQSVQINSNINFTQLPRQPSNSDLCKMKIQEMNCQEDPNKLVQLLQWRQKTQFPIVKIKDFCFLQKKQPNRNKTSFQIQLDDCYSPLTHATKKLVFIQAIYILKQCLVGIERLFYKFGGFQLTPNMIRIDSKGKCKVWISQDIFSMNPDHNVNKKQSQMIKSCCLIVQKLLQRSRRANNFLTRIQNCNFFFQAINTIEVFVQQQKIKLPSKISNLQQKSNKLFGSVALNLRKNQTKIQRNSVKTPSFLKNSPRKNKTKPLKRKLTSLTTQQQVKQKNTGSETNLSMNFNLSKKSFFKSNENSTNYNQNNKNREHQKVEDQFLKDLNLRLIEPVQKNNQQQTPRIKFTNGWNSTKDCWSPTPVSPLGRVSQMEIGSDKKDKFFFRNSPYQKLTPFQTAQNMFMTVTPVKNLDRNLSSISNFSQSPVKKFKKLEQIGDNLESLEDFSLESERNQFVISFNGKKDKRKYSGQLDKVKSSRDEMNNNLSSFYLQISQHKSTNELQVPSSQRRKTEYYIKHQNSDSSSGKQKQKSRQSGNNELRDTIMSRNGWTEKITLIVSGQDRAKPNLNKIQTNDIKMSFFDGQQVIQNCRYKTSDLEKLGTMGRNVKSSMISEQQFKLQIQQRIEREKAVRKDMLTLFE